MPRRAAPGDRAAIERALGPELREQLATLCRALGLAPRAWQRIPALEAVFTTLAAVRLAERLQRQEGLPWERALGAAAAQLGVSEKTLGSRLRRWFVEAYSGDSS